MSATPRALLLLVLIAGLAACPVSSAAAEWDLESDTWAATDALGRTLPGSPDCGSPKPSKTVGIFYFLWHNPSAAGLYDISKILAADPANPAWGPRWAFHHWGESELGYYTSIDEYVMRKHCQMLVDAGVDVLCLDATNALTYTTEYTALCNVMQKIRDEGGRTPRTCFVVNSDPAGTVQKLYDDLYSKNLYPQLWYYWNGKPLMLAPSDGLDATLLSFFTFRKTWAWNSGPDNWQFMSKYPQQVGYDTDPNSPEEVSVSVAEHPLSNIGRSCQSVLNGGAWVPTEPATDQYGQCPTMGQGLYFAQQWSRVGAGAGQVSPPFVFVTGWNEWIAQRFIEGLDVTGITMCGRTLNYGDTFFVDEYSQEYSRDIEPMSGGHTDNYYYQLAGGVRRYKGVRNALGAGPAATITIDGDFSDWSAIDQEYRDTVGDTEHRNSIGYAGANTYINNTGRNDFVRCKVARDATNVYFYVETSEDITPYTDPDWMMLFIDSDCNNSTGWNGYDYLVNFPPIDAATTSVKQNAGGWNWSQVGTASYKVTANKMEIAIPLAMIGKSGAANIALDFHWADNIQPTGDITEFFVSGDSAPNRRFKYHYDTAAAGPPWEFASSTEGWSAAHSVYSFKQSSGSVQGTIFGSDPYINGPSTMGVNAGMVRYVRISMRNTTASANTGEIRWKTLADPSYSSTRSVTFPVICDNTYHTYTIDMTGNSQWTDWSYAFQVHPTGASSGSFYIDYIRFGMDTTGPTGSMSIDSGAASTTSPTVTLSLTAADAESGVSKMRFSNDNSAWSAWEDYATGRDWNLSLGAGVKTVYAQFRDRHMNRSDTYSSSIELIGVPPSGTVTINSGAAYCNSVGVGLSLSASGPYGVSDMRLANVGSSWDDWRPYATSAAWTLPAGDGTKTVCVQFRDSQGYISSTASASIVVDTQPPTASIAINAGAAATNSADVYLLMSVADTGSGVSQMKFVNSGSSWSAWEPFVATKSWTLSAGDGARTVYAQFTDAAGNRSAVVTDSIVVDTIAPTPPGIPVDAGAYSSGDVVFEWTAATDAGSGIGGYRCRVGSTAGAADVFDGSVGNVLAETVPGLPGNRYYCRVQAVDNAGNASAWSADTDGVSVVANPGISVAAARLLPTDVSVGLSSKAVTAVFADGFYIQDADRTAGIMVRPVGAASAGLSVGDLVDVGGPVRVDAGGQRWIDATVSVVQTAH